MFPSRYRSIFVVTMLTGSAVALASGCAETSIEVGTLVDQDAGPQPPSFTDPDSGSDADARAQEPVLLCIATACPAPFDTCGTGYRCSTNLSNDSNNCGECGKVCPDSFGYLNMTSTCVDGTCEPTCGKKLAGGKFWNYADCNGVAEDGCEINISTDPNNCGACGNKCADGVSCIDGKCGCDPGYILCPDPYAAKGKCIDARHDDANCGACGNRCGTPADAGAPPDNMVYGCVDSQCGQLKCEDMWGNTWANCDNNLANGCEVYIGTNDSLIDPNNCGKCGKKCVGADQVCTDANYDYVAECLCEKPHETRCGSKDWGNLGCFDLLNDPDNCGTCSNKCTAYQDNTAAVCRKGACELECLPGWGDCDGEPGNGCETNLKSSGGHCGACGNRCDTQAGQPCVEGQCAMTECDAGVVTQ